MGYEVRGGPESIRFSFAELERTTAMLSGASGELSEGVSYLAGSPQFPAAMLALGTILLRTRVLGAVAAVAEAGVLCASGAVEAGVLALKVASARSRYEQMESAAQISVNLARGSLVPLGIMWDLATNKGRPRTQTTEDLINQLPWFLGLPFGLLGDNEHGGVFGTPFAQRLYPQLADFLKDQNLVELAPIEVIGQGREQVVEFEGTIDSLVDLQERAEREPPGSLLVTRIDAPQGPLFILTIPGTQADPLKELPTNFHKIRAEGQRQNMGNPWDGVGIVEGMGNESRNLLGSVEESLVRSGAKNGDRVIVSGYSQGGIHGVNIVNNERLRKLYKFSFLSTYGSPTGNVPVPDDTLALHLEDRNDVVPGTDGVRNPDEPNRLTVVFDGPDGTTQLGNDGFGEAHKLENYQSHAKELAVSEDPGVVESLGLLGSLLGRRPRGRVRSYQLGRAPQPKMKVPQTNDRRSKIAPPH